MKTKRQFTVRYLTPDGRRGTWLPHTDDLFATAREAMDFAASELGEDYQVTSAYENPSSKKRRIQQNHP